MARRLVFDYREADLCLEDRALCDYAVKLSLAPGEANEADVRHLREFGFTDEQITVATQVVGYFNYINRVADGLGVDNEPWMEPSAEEWKQRKGKGYLASRSQAE